MNNLIQYSRILKENQEKKYILQVKINQGLNEYLNTHFNTLIISPYSIDQFDPNLLEFNIAKYTKLATRTNEFNAYTKVINTYFNMLSMEEAASIVMLLYIGKIMIINLANTISKNITEEQKLSEMEHYIESYGEIITNTFTYNDKALLKKLHKFVLQLHIPDLSEAGTRPQDSPELTFYYPHYIELYKLIMLTKILLPILAELMDIFTIHITSGSNRNLIDIVTAKLFNHIGYQELNVIMEKLYTFVQNEVNKFLASIKNKEELEMNILFNMYSPEFLMMGTFANLFTRSFINMDIFFQDDVPEEAKNDKMFNITSKTTSAIRIYLSNSHKRKTKIKLRFEEISDSDEEQAVVDIHSWTTKVSSDKIVLIEQMIEELVNLKLQQFNITHSNFEEIYKFYLEHPIYIGVHNEFIVALLFNEDIYGSRSLKYIDYKTFVKLVSLAQLEMINCNALLQLIHFISVRIDQVSKQYPSIADTRLGNYVTNPYYTAIEKAFDHIDQRVNKVNYVFDKIVQMLKTNYFKINTAFPILKQIEPDRQNGSLFEYNHNFLVDITKFVFDILQPKLNLKIEKNIQP